jgi:hypothetical protein
LWAVDDPARGASLIPSTVEAARRFVETLVLERITVHSDGMSNSSGGGPYYWCLRHNRVETDQDVCPASMTMGPYESPTEAEQALTRVAKRNEQWDAEDAQWTGEQS